MLAVVFAQKFPLSSLIVLSRLLACAHTRMCACENARMRILIAGEGPFLRGSSTIRGSSFERAAHPRNVRPGAHVPIALGRGGRYVIIFARTFEACLRRRRRLRPLLVSEKSGEAGALLLRCHYFSPMCFCTQRQSAVISWAALPSGSNSVTASPLRIARANALRSPSVTGATG